MSAVATKAWHAELEQRIGEIRASGGPPAKGVAGIPISTRYTGDECAQAKWFIGHVNDRPFCGAAAGTLFLGGTREWIESRDEQGRYDFRLSFSLWPAPRDNFAPEGGLMRARAAGEPVAHVVGGKNFDEIP